MKTQMLGALILACAVTGVAAASEMQERGARAYTTCAGCHGFAAEGNEQVSAPALAGQAAWYLSRQIRSFRSGVRGHDAADVTGRTMATMAGALRSEDEIDAVAAYIASLPKTAKKGESISGGDAAKGASIYPACGGCHGAKGQGMEALGAPALAGFSAWDHVAQLKKFRAGRRGSQPSDTYGQQMVAGSAILANDQALMDVVAYIETL